MIEKYKLIYADPPWSYNNKASNGAADNHYETLSLSELGNMSDQIKRSSAADSVLALWVTPPMLQEGLTLMAAWGFKYKTVLFNWMKRTKRDKLFFGGGNYTRAGSEFCLVGIRGKGLKRHNASIRQVLDDIDGTYINDAPVREHSRKPDEVRDALTLLYGDVPRIEMFARSRHRGWAAHGLEKDRFLAESESLPDMSFLE